MPFEVEQKYRVDDLASVRQRLAVLGASECDTVDHADRYYRHPVRDFAATDEAFRLRQSGARNCLTYKGPKIDATTKSRYEEEVALADGPAPAASCDAILRRLGFEPVAIVRKRRQTLTLPRNGLHVEIALDAVADVGVFVELEIGVEAADPASPAVAAAKSVLAALAAEIGLGDPERRSYLELLLRVSPTAQN